MDKKVIMGNNGKLTDKTTEYLLAFNKARYEYIDFLWSLVMYKVSFGLILILFLATLYWVIDLKLYEYWF